MTEASGSNSGTAYMWLFVFINAGVITLMWLVGRRRRWPDFRPLGRATTMPAEHVPAEPRKVRDMVAGEEGFVDSFSIATSSRRQRAFVEWDARLREPPEDRNNPFSPLPIRRLARGFSVTVRAGDTFRTSSYLWGWYAPVTEILQAAPEKAADKKPAASN